MGQIQGVRVVRNAPSAHYLFFADDYLIFCEASNSCALALMAILKQYEKTSGQQVNLDKSVVLFSNNVEEEVRSTILGVLNNITVFFFFFLVSGTLGCLYTLEGTKGLPITQGKNLGYPYTLKFECICKQIQIYEVTLDSIKKCTLFDVNMQMSRAGYFFFFRNNLFLPS